GAHLAAPISERRRTCLAAGPVLTCTHRQTRRDRDPPGHCTYARAEWSCTDPSAGVPAAALAAVAPPTSRSRPMTPHATPEAVSFHRHHGILAGLVRAAAVAVLTAGLVVVPSAPAVARQAASA